MEKYNVIEELKQTIEQMRLTQNGQGVHLNIVTDRLGLLLERVDLIEKKLSNMPAFRNNFESNTPLMLVK